MYSHRLAARAILSGTTQSEWDMIIHEARLSPRQKEIVNMKFGEGLCNWEIAQRLNVNQSVVDKQLARAYDKINNVLLHFNLDRL